MAHDFLIGNLTVAVGSALNADPISIGPSIPNTDLDAVPSGGAPGAPVYVSQVTSGVFTFYFSEERWCQSYVDGTWAVSGPVTITDITPRCEFADTGSISGVINGAMLNPDPWVLTDTTQGFSSGDTTPRGDSAPANNYTHAANVDPNNPEPGYGGPLTMQPGDALVKVQNWWPAGVGIDQGQSALDGNRPAYYRGTILQCVADASSMLSNLIRPHPYDPTVLARDFLPTYRLPSFGGKLDDLPSVALVAGQPDISATYDDYWTTDTGKAPKFELTYSILERELHFGNPLYPDTNPGLNRDTDGQFHMYGYDNSVKVSAAMAQLCSDYSSTEKVYLFHSVVQYGHDMYSAARFQLAKGETQARSMWNCNGGYGYGRPDAMVFAGWALDNTDMLNSFAGPELDSVQIPERDALFIVDQDFVDTYGGATGHTSAEVGMPEWGIRHRAYIEGWSGHASARVWTAAYRRCCSGRSMQGSMLANLLLGLGSYLPTQYIGYTDRYVQAEDAWSGGLPAYNAQPSWILTWYNAHRSAATPALQDYSGYYPIV